VRRVPDPGGLRAYDRRRAAVSRRQDARRPGSPAGTDADGECRARLRRAHSCAMP
jgi:hypothetical protein